MVPAEALSSFRARQKHFGIHQVAAEAQRVSLQRAKPTVFVRQSLAAVKPEEAESIRVANGKVLTLDAEGPSFTPDGAPGGGTTKYKDAIEIVSPNHRILTSRMLTPDGTWQQFMTAHYRRVK